MLNFGNREFRNLQEQVYDNADKINALLSGLQIVGRVNSLSDISEDVKSGTAYLVGSTKPYKLYIYGRGEWIDLGEFPFRGPQGIQGPKGDTATIGSIVSETKTLEANLNAYVSAEVKNNNIFFKFEIPEGKQGVQGPIGRQGPQGIQGEKGDKGDIGQTAYAIKILGVIESEDALPNPKSVDRNSAYLIGTSEPYALYIIIGDDILLWENIGTFSPNNITVDTALSESSNNPVQNKIITKAFRDLESKALDISKVSEFNTYAGSIAITNDNIDLSKYNKRLIKINVKGSASRNILPLLTNGTYTNGGMTVVVNNGLITTLTKTAGSSATIDIPIAGGEVISLKSGQVIYYGYSVSGSGSRMRIYLRDSLGNSPSKDLFNNETISSSLTITRDMNVNYIRFYQTPNEEFSYSFTTPLYMNLNEPSPYEKYGLYSTASLSIDGTDIGTYNYAADGIYKEFQTVVPSITSRLSITNGELGILYGKNIDDSTNSFIITSDEVFNSNSLVVNNLIWSEKKVQVHANANSQFQQKDYIIYSGFEPGGSITLTVDKITNFKQDLPIQVFFVDSKGTNLSEYRVRFGYKGTSASNYIQSFKVPVNTASITVRFSATVMENTLPEFTVEFDNARLYSGAIPQDIDLSSNLTAQNVYTKPLVLYSANNNVMSIAHQGARCNAPANSLPSLIIAKQRGFEAVEFDVNLSKDGEYIISHDSALTFALYDLNGVHDNMGYLYYIDSNSNGYWYDSVNDKLYTYNYDFDKYDEAVIDLSTLTQVRYNTTISNLLGKDIRRIDYGSWFGPQFAGTHMLTFREAMVAIKELGLIPLIDFKISITTEVITDLANIVSQLGMKYNTYWVVNGYYDPATVKSIWPDANLVLQCPSDINVYNKYHKVWKDQGGKVICSNKYSELPSSDIIDLLNNNGFVVACWYDEIESTQSKEYILSDLLAKSDLGLSAFVISKYSFKDAMDYKYFNKQYYK